jgi:hypothetical protein
LLINAIVGAAFGTKRDVNDMEEQQGRGIILDHLQDLVINAIVSAALGKKRAVDDAEQQQIRDIIFGKI